MPGVRAPADPTAQEEAIMSAISTTPGQTQQLTMLLTALRSRSSAAAANGAVRSAAAAALERLRWAYEAAAIDAEDVVTQAEEALSLG
jgi:hypothetical protein